jgi:hypothetical protein
MVICLASGAALDAANRPHQGKGSGELGLVRQVLGSSGARELGSLRPGDVMLADALYCNYFPIASLMATGVDVLFEQNGSRTSDFRRGQSPLLDHRRVSKDDLPHQAHRAVDASSRECEKKSQTLPLAQDAQGSRSKAGSTTRACLGHEVSAIRA